VRCGKLSRVETFRGVEVLEMRVDDKLPTADVSNSLASLSSSRNAMDVQEQVPEIEVSNLSTEKEMQQLWRQSSQSFFDSSEHPDLTLK